MRTCPAARAAVGALLLLGPGCADEWLEPAPTPDAGGEPDPCELAKQQDPGRVEHIAAGYNHACAVTNLGSMYCWGHPADGASGLPANFPYTGEPVKAPDHHCLRTLALGVYHGCGLTYDARLLCWGRNGYGELGVPAAGGGPFPVEVPGMGHASQVGADWAASAALFPTGAVWLWGAYLQVEAFPLPVPGQPFGPFNGVAALPSSGIPQCVVTNERKVLCWGLYSGNGTAPPVDHPVEAAGLKEVEEVAVGWRRRCARTVSGRVYCWGDGPLGDGTEEHGLVPVEVVGIEDAVQIAVDACACAVLAGGQVVCWGRHFRACGQPPKTDLLTPKVVEGLPAAIQVETGGFDFTCALTEEREVYCWGDNGYGQLGAGYVGGDSHVPVQVKLPKQFEW